ncbi:MAG: SusC/RagA family TonB-linked outer membrane protein, partial [Bacteroidales bacterium]|nr:SusC/RagA family TonB-linked outer membrane protein [Bacteroidales bacterium]
MDCKTLNFRYLIAFLLCITFAGLSLSASAQKALSGKITDENSQPLIGVTVSIEGTTVGTISDIDGNYQLQVPADKENGMVVFSFIGYETVSMPMPATGKLDVQMRPSVTELNEVVAIGYGTKRKGDLTGSIASVSEKDFNGGVVSSPEQLINGKVAGVQIMSNGGSPSAGSTIKVRGGASLNASNNPLIVLDGVPLENGGISGNDNNFLALINPADIESMTVLKDASSTAIYGSRASNGVIIITTKKGAKDKLKVNFNTTNSVSFKTTLADMLDADQLREVVNSAETKAIKGDLTKYLGDANTDWNDEIYRAAFGTDNNLSVSGNIADVLPARVSVGYMNQNGILDNDNTKRYSGNINLNPTFLHDDLKVNFSMKASWNENTFADQGAIYGAATFNPTQPVYSDNENIFLGYNEAYIIGGDGSINKITSAASNPVGLLNYHENESTVKRLVTNLDIDYTFPFLRDLKAHVTGGLDFAKGEGHEYIPQEAYSKYVEKGYTYNYGPQKNSNKLFTGYLNYTKKLDAVNFDITAGYDYQYWNSNTPAFYYYNIPGDITGTSIESDQTHVLLSYYGRANATFLNKYMVTATMRRDGTSRFSKDERWGTFPSVALAWRVSEESFMEGTKDVLNNLKLRVSYGVTGQQDGIGNYNYLPIYSQSAQFYQYLWNGTPISTYLPSAYAEN